MFLLGRWCGDGEDEWSMKIREVISNGLKSFRVQHDPHYVLLDFDWYRSCLVPLLLELVLVWLCQDEEGEDEGEEGVQKKRSRRCEIRDELYHRVSMNHESSNSSSTIHKDFILMKRITLCVSWIRVYFPHCISKVHRVSYGILVEDDFKTTNTKCESLSRRLMAIPFVGKDVPSLSSEFAHVDISIGLTILAYRYHGLREQDVCELVNQLKTEFSKETGTRHRRSSYVLFETWRSSLDEILPLDLFRVQDKIQIRNLLFRIKKQAEAVHRFLSLHVFPRTMRFHCKKISASGHELVGMFRVCIGFSGMYFVGIFFFLSLCLPPPSPSLPLTLNPPSSGTPSSIMPRDMGTCNFEAGSDGRVIDTLTNSSIVNVKHLEANWNSLNLLRQVACSSENYHVLIDTGALITGLKNIEVVRELSKFLRPSIWGVVYMDHLDRRVVYVRDKRKVISLKQCGIPTKHRFCFYDQIHTTGMDVEHHFNARAVLTIGKDMCFRDYAQGAYRMRGIGIRGQKLTLYLIPEIRSEIQRELRIEKKVTIRHVMRWLIKCTMRMRFTCLEKLKRQEYLSVWRKRAFRNGIVDVFVEQVSHDVIVDEHDVMSRSFEEKKWSKILKLSQEDREIIKSLKMMTSSRKDETLLLDTKQEREMQVEQLEESEIEDQVQVMELFLKRKDRTRAWKVLSEECESVKGMMKKLPKKLYVTRNWSSNDEVMKDVITFVRTRDDDDDAIVVVTLAEAETMRTRKTKNSCCWKLGMVRGHDVIYFDEEEKEKDLDIVVMLRFLNGEMYFSKNEIQVLKTFGDTILRRKCFDSFLRRRGRRDQRVWLDTPVANVLMSKYDDRTEMLIQSLRTKLRGTTYRGGSKMNPMQFSRFLRLQSVEDARNIIRSFKWW